MNEWFDANLNVVDFGFPAWTFGGNREGLVDPRGKPAAAKRHLCQHVIRRVHLVADEAMSTIEAAPQVISAKAVLNALFHPGASCRERNGVPNMADERVDVSLRGGDAALFGNDHPGSDPR